MVDLGILIDGKLGQLGRTGSLGGSGIGGPSASQLQLLDPLCLPCIQLR